MVVSEQNRLVPKVLIIDDEPHIRLLLELTLTELSEHRFEVCCAENASQALLAINTQTPDLILLDIYMPEMNGYELCRKLKQNPLTANIPIIFVTGENASIKETLGFELGAVDYICKPFNPNVLLARVENQLKLNQH